MGAFIFYLNRNFKDMKKESGFTFKLGLFVILGLALFVFTIYYIGSQQNLFGSNFHLKSVFKTVSGLKEGNNIRFSGINIGTVSGIELITDTSVMVDMVIRKKIQQFIKSDAIASIGSDGLMGDKVLTISPGTVNGLPVKNHDEIGSKSSPEIADIMSSLKTSVDNAGIITGELAKFSYKLNNTDGLLTQLISDPGFSNSLKSTLVNLQTSSAQFAIFTTKMNDGKLDSTMANLQSGTKGLSDNMAAVKNSFLLRGYFRKKKKTEDRKLAESKKTTIPVKNKKKEVVKDKPIADSLKL